VIGLGLTTPGMAGLEVTIPGEDWRFLLRRVSLASDSVFSSYHGTPLRSRDIARFLPNWSDLSWTAVPDSFLSHSESCAQDITYQVNAWALLNSTKQHHDVIYAYLQFMACS